MRLFTNTLFVWFICLLLLIPSVRAGEAYYRNISASQWQKLTDDKAFSYKDKKEKTPEAKPPSRNYVTDALRALYEFFDSGFGTLLLWAIVIGIVAYILHRVLLSKENFLFGRTKKKMTTNASPELTEDIDSTNWEALLHQAVQGKNLQLAVRYSYMWLLQILQTNQLIQYRTDKTNFEYYKELENTSFKQPFKHLSRQYEYAHYGNYTLSPEAYNEYIELFNNLRKQLGRA